MPLLATLLLASVPVKVAPAKTLVGIRPIAFAAAPYGFEVRRLPRGRQRPHHRREDAP